MASCKSGRTASSLRTSSRRLRIHSGRTNLTRFVGWLAASYLRPHAHDFIFSSVKKLLACVEARGIKWLGFDGPSASRSRISVRTVLDASFDWDWKQPTEQQVTILGPCLPSGQWRCDRGAGRSLTVLARGPTPYRQEKSHDLFVRPKSLNAFEPSVCSASNCILPPAL